MKFTELSRLLLLCSLVFCVFGCGKQQKKTSPKNTEQEILATANKHSIYLWDTSNGRRLKELKSHSDNVISLAFSPDGTTLASGGEDRKIVIWRSGPPPKIKKSKP